MNGAPKEGAEILKEKALHTANRMIPCFQNGISSNLIAVISSVMIFTVPSLWEQSRQDIFLCDAECITVSTK